MMVYVYTYILVEIMIEKWFYNYNGVYIYIVIDSYSIYISITIVHIYNYIYVYVWITCEVALSSLFSSSLHEVLDTNARSSPWGPVKSSDSSRFHLGTAWKKPLVWCWSFQFRFSNDSPWPMAMGVQNLAMNSWPSCGVFFFFPGYLPHPLRKIPGVSESMIFNWLWINETLLPQQKLRWTQLLNYP